MDTITQKFSPGDFSFLIKSNDSLSKMWTQSCIDAYNECEKEDLWPFFKNFSPPPNKGYMWWSHDDPNGAEWKRVSKILSKIDKGHSGASWACLMRTLEKIAKIGWDPYVAQHFN